MIRPEQIQDSVKVMVSINGRQIDYATISVEGNIAYICQDWEDGAECTNKHGYTYSWSIGLLSALKTITKLKKNLSIAGVEDLRLTVGDWNEEEN